jgi:thiosulfate reductase cytochrome b subunit
MDCSQKFMTGVAPPTHRRLRHEEVTAMAEQVKAGGERVTYRHTLTVRVTHWINVVCLTILLMSGLQIFNAHPALYLGQLSDFDHPVFAMTAAPTANGKPAGYTSVLGHTVVTTGVLGLSTGPSGRLEARGFPDWATIPGVQDLATGRRWHFFFAWLFVINGLVYLAYSFGARHVRDLWPSAAQLRGIGRSILDHARLHFPRGAEARHYNVLQKLAYLAVIFILLPLMLLTGLTMSPGMDAGFPQLLALFGGRQTARTIHFITASAIVAFVLVHVVMVLLTGLWNNLRSMITGRYVIASDGREEGGDAAD